MNNIINEFNNTLDEFMLKMINQFPQEANLKKYYNSFKMSKMYDNSIPIKLFMGGSLPFKEQIKSRDADFFKNRKTFLEACVQHSSFTSETGLSEHYDSLSDKSKTAIWDYIQTLFVMGEMYINKDTSILNNMNNVYSQWSHKYCEDDGKISEEFIRKINN